MLNSPDVSGQPIEDGEEGCPETSVTIYHYSLHNNPEQRSSNLLRGGSLKSRILYEELSSKWDESYP